MFNARILINKYKFPIYLNIRGVLQGYFGAADFQLKRFSATPAALHLINSLNDPQTRTV